MQIKLKSNLNIKSMFSVLLCRVLFDACYYYLTVPMFSYAGFLCDASKVEYVFSWIVLLLFAPVIAKLNREASKMSDFIMLMIMLLSFIPLTTMIGLYGFPVLYIVFAVLFWCNMVIFYYMFTSERFRLKSSKLFSLKNSSSKCVFCLLLMIAVVVILYVSGRYRHFALNFNLFQVYELRSAARGFGLSTAVSYLISMAGDIILVMLLYALYSKRLKLSVFLVIVQLLNFSIGGQKSILFKLILGLGFFFMYEKILKGKLVQWTNGLLAVALAEYVCFKTYLLNNLIIRRACFLTNLLSYNYFDFFTTHTPDYYAQSFLRHLGVASEYPPISFMIGDVYYNNPFTCANNGLIADAITNFGWIGILLLPIILIALFCLFDRAAKKLPPVIYICSATTIAVGLTNTFLPTCLLTHGFLVLLICLFVISKQIEIEENKL